MSPVAFQIVSDLHLETQTLYASFVLKQTAPNLALLGDIGHVANDALFVFLDQQLRRYWNVLYVLGNHEPVLGSWPAAKRRVQDFADKMERLRVHSTIGRFIFLDQGRYDIDNLTVLGCTLFSRVTKEQATEVSSRFIDFQQIQTWTVGDHIDAHTSDLQWLNTQVSEIYKSEPQREIVIFTHHSPSLDARTMDKEHHDGSSPVISGFATDLSAEECWTNPSVVRWAFGHTHVCCDFNELGKRMVANQMGYATALEKAFDGKKIFLVGREGYK